MRRVCFCFLLLFGVVSSPVVSGTIYDDSSYQPLFADHRAKAVGDVITVLVYEVASASASADTDSTTEVGVGMSATDTYTPVNGNLALNNDFKGGGTLNRNGKLVARVSVTVQTVYPNGDLFITGKQRIEFNNETQEIEVKGKLRLFDISSDNTVLSTRLADAEIRYIGDGLLTSGEKPGIITRFFNWLF